MFFEMRQPGQLLKRVTDDLNDLYKINTKMVFDEDSYVDYNILRKNDKEIIIELCVPGYSQDDLTVDLIDNYITVRNENPLPKRDMKADRVGFEVRDVNIRFRVDPYTNVTDCVLENGILSIHLKEKTKENSKSIPINSGKEKPTQLLNE